MLAALILGAQPTYGSVAVSVRTWRAPTLNWRKDVAGTGSENGVASASSARPPRFRVTRADEPPVAVLVVEIDLVTAPRLKDALRAIPKGSPLVVDLCETAFIDSSGLRLLLISDERRHVERAAHGARG